LVQVTDPPSYENDYQGATRYEESRDWDASVSGITQMITITRPESDNTITTAQGNNTTVAPGGEHHTGTEQLTTYRTIQDPLADHVGGFTTSTTYVSLPTTSSNNSSNDGDYGVTGGGEGSGEQDGGGVLDMKADAAFEMMWNDPTFRAMIETFLRRRESELSRPGGSSFSDQWILDNCIRMYWEAKINQLSEAEKHTFQNHTVDEVKAKNVGTHWIFIFVPDSVKLFVFAPEAAKEIEEQRLARAKATEEMTSAALNVHYKKLIETYKAGEYTEQTLNAAVGIYGDHFINTVFAPLAAFKKVGQNTTRTGSQTARNAPVNGVIDFAESAGRLGGKLWGADRIPTLTRFLENRGVKVLLDQDELLAKLAKQQGLSGADAAFVVGKDGKLFFLLSKNPTRREVLHELSHFLHRQKIGGAAYDALTKAQKEAWVSNFLRNSNN